MGLGAGELALILVIAYVVVGPEDMVKLARTLARTLRQLRKLTVDLHEEAVGGINLPSVPDLDLSPDTAGRKDIIKDAAGSVTSDLDGVLKEIQKAEEQLREKRTEEQRNL